MTRVLTARPGEDAAGILARGRALDQRLWHLPAPLRAARAAAALLQTQAVSVVSLATPVQDLEPAVRCGAALGVHAVVVEGGGLDGRDAEEAADALVRALHGPLADGVPIAVRNGGQAEDLLGITASEWVLGELPRLALWFDPARALARLRTASGAALSAWTDAFAARTGGVFVHGLGSDGAGGAHPADDGPDWAALRGALPGTVPWVLDLDPRLGEDDVADALRYLRGLGA